MRRFAIGLHWIAVAGLMTAATGRAAEGPAPPDAGAAAAKDAEAVSAASARDRTPSQTAAPAGPNTVVRKAAPGPPVTLAEAMRAADQQNRSLSAAMADIDIARAVKKRAWSALLPTAAAMGAYTHFDGDTKEIIGGGDPAVYGALDLPVPPVSEVVSNRRNQVAGSLRIDAPLVVPRGILAVRSAGKALALAEIQTAYSRQRLLETVGEVFYQALGLREAVERMTRQIEGTTRHLAEIRAKQDQGPGREIDLLRAEAQVAHEAQVLESQIAAFEEARTMLGYLTGDAGLPMPRARLAFFDHEDNVVSPMEGLALETTWGAGEALFAQAEGRRLDLKAGRIALEQADVEVKGQWMQFLPTIAAAWQLDHFFRSPNVLEDEDPTHWAVTLSLSIPLYSQTRYADLDLARAVRLKYGYLLADAERRAAMEVHNARRAFVTAIEQLKRLDALTVQSRRVLAMAEQNYRDGAGSGLEVSEASETHRGLELELVARHVAARLALLKLAFVLGEDLFEIYTNAER